MFKKALILTLALVTLCLSCLTSCNVSDIFGGNTDNGENENEGNGENEGGNENGEGSTGGNGESDDGSGDTVEDSIPVPERFKTPYPLDRAKLEAAADAATKKLIRIARESEGNFPGTSSVNYQYSYGKNNNWVCGMYTGCYLMAYQLTGNEIFKDVVDAHILSFIDREKNKVGMDDHDVGFAFVPSCVGAYKVFGSESARDAALRAVEYYYDTSYSKEGKFIIRSHGSWDAGGGCRTMMDSMMNATLLFWAGDYLNESTYSTAGADHTNTTIDLLVRSNGSTYHHYQFDPKTAAPLYGLTWQGYSNESCWSRGQSWGIYGFSIAHSYTGDPKILEAQSNLVYYMLSRLPDDSIPYWDYVFLNGSSEPRDASAAAIAVCGLLDMAERLPEGSEQRTVYESAAAQMMESLIDLHTTEIDVEYDGLIHGVTHGKPQNLAIEECAPYADYFYLEALARYLAEDFIRPW